MFIPISPRGSIRDTLFMSYLVLAENQIAHDHRLVTHFLEGQPRTQGQAEL